MEQKAAMLFVIIIFKNRQVMPDLDKKSVHEFWHEYPEPSLYKVVSFMEGVENWTLDDNPEVEEAINELGNMLDSIGNVDLQEEDKLIEISSFLKIGRTLRLLQCLNDAHPGAAAKIIMHAESTADENNSAKLFLQRNIVFERLRLLSKVFNEERLNTILKIIENK